MSLVIYFLLLFMSFFLYVCVYFFFSIYLLFFRLFHSFFLFLYFTFTFPSYCLFIFFFLFSVYFPFRIFLFSFLFLYFSFFPFFLISSSISLCHQSLICRTPLLNTYSVQEPEVPFVTPGFHLDSTWLQTLVSD
jgi:hypothetical protein